MRLSPIDSAHAQAGAQMIEYGGCSVPARYGNVLEEYMSVRHAAGLFDMSHMTALALEGKGAAGLLQTLSATDMAPLAEGLSCRAILCNERGGVVDAFVAYPFDNGVLCASGPPYDAACAGYLTIYAPGSANLSDRTAEYARFAVHGPQAKEILRGLRAPTSLIYARTPGFCGRFLLEGVPVFVSLTDYTGERGWDLMVPRISAPVIWSRMVSLGARPCGLAALDILRVEAGRRACGHELTPDIGPAEAGLLDSVAFHKSGFPGREALLQRRENPRGRLVGLRCQPMNVFAPGQPVYIGGAARGKITSGCANPEYGGSVALALMDAGAPSVGLYVDDDGRRRDAAVFEV